MPRDIETAQGESCDQASDLLLDDTGTSLYAYGTDSKCSGGQGLRLTKGLQLFNFTGTSQAMPRTGLLTTASIIGVHWDNQQSPVRHQQCVGQAVRIYGHL